VEEPPLDVPLPEPEVVPPPVPFPGAELPPVPLPPPLAVTTREGEEELHPALSSNTPIERRRRSGK
jgi:hypothetical protein